CDLFVHAEDGIRCFHVTGVQTCALPISLPPSIGDTSVLHGKPLRIDGKVSDRFWPEAWAMRRLLRDKTVRELREAGVPVTAWERSEERRVGKAGRSRWAAGSHMTKTYG